MFFFFQQKTAYEVRISDWSSDVCSSDLSPAAAPLPLGPPHRGRRPNIDQRDARRTGFAAGADAHWIDSVPPIWRTKQVCPFALSSRSEQRRVGTRCVSTCRSRWAPYILKTHNMILKQQNINPEQD